MGYHSSIHTGDYFLLDLEQIGITDKVDIAIAQCVNQIYGVGNDRNYEFLCDYICLGRKYREKFFIHRNDIYSEWNPVIKKLSEEEYYSLMREIKLRLVLN
jgi:hypothetical protein